MEKEIMEQEVLHLEEVQSKLEAELVKEQEILEQQKEELVGERRKMWEECAHGVSDFDDIIDMAAYDQQVRDEFGHYIRKDEMVRQLSYLLKTPYFGRIDFKEAGETECEQIYIGRYGFCNRKTYQYEIYDWRTPIASMFYDCSLGKASYQCPGGKVQGDLSCKRQYRIEEGVLKYCYDTNTAVQDEILGRVLCENTDTVLRVIVDTITKDQNQAIRLPYAEDLLVTGPAGSGKTSVGMHRLAYLLYHNRNNLTSEKIVVMSRNQIFSSYISGVLPELGEENVQEVLFDSLIDKGISRKYKKKDYYEQAEYLLEHEGDTLRKQSIRLKYSREFISYLKENLKMFRGKKKDGEAALELYLRLLEQYTSASKKEIYLFTRSCIQSGTLYYEDMLVVGYVRILIRGIRPWEQINYMVLDEAQDYNLLQLTIIKALYPKSRFTILADVNQVVYSEIATTDLTVFYEIFGSNVRGISLKKSYRSTAPINRFAFGIIGINDPELYMDRPGKEPVCLETKDMIQGLANTIEQISTEQSIGILTCDRKSASTIMEKLGTHLAGDDRKIQYILRPDKILKEKIVVMPVLLAKGLEFDVVIVWDDRTKLYWTTHKNLKYLMCTRALHELFFISGDAQGVPESEKVKK